MRGRSSGLRIGGFPTKKLVKLKYVSYGTLTPTASDNASLVYRLNGAYDPYHPAGGHQPRFWDQWTALYNQYTVLGTKVRLEWRPTTAAKVDVSPGQFGLYIPPDPGATTLPPYGTIPATVTEHRGVGPVRNYGGGTYTGAGRSGRAIYVTKKWSAKKYFGTSDIIDNAATPNKWSALKTAVPTEEANIILWAGGFNAAVAPGAFDYKIVLEFIVLFQDLVDPVES